MLICNGIEKLEYSEVSYLKWKTLIDEDRLKLHVVRALAFPLLELLGRGLKIVRAGTSSGTKREVSDQAFSS